MYQFNFFLQININIIRDKIFFYENSLRRKIKEILYIVMIINIYIIFFTPYQKDAYSIKYDCKRFTTKN